MSDESDTPDPSNETDGEETTEDDESNTSGRTKIRLRAYDLEVEAESEDASFEEMAEVLTDEFESIRRDALVGEYTEIEERNLHGVFLGGGGDR